MRRIARVDANQAEIVEALREVGATVQLLHQVGGGCPDLLVGFRDENFLLEVKDDKKPPSKRVLTEDEQRWHDGWQGQVVTVENIKQALRVIGVNADVH